MKLLVHVFTFCLSLSSVNAQHYDDDTTLCLKLLGRVIDPDRSALPDCKVELFDGLQVVDSLLLNDEAKKFTFILQRNKAYALRLSMPGYVTQLITVNTDFPHDIIDVVPFQFNTRLIREELASKLNRNAMDFPIAIVHFDPVTESFIHNESYTSNIKSEIGIRDSGSGKGVATRGKKRNQTGSILKSF